MDTHGESGIRSLMDIRRSSMSAVCRAEIYNLFVSGMGLLGRNVPMSWQRASMSASS